WVIGVVIAFTVSPTTWIGASSSTNPHVYTAVFIGGFCCFWPMYLCWQYPGETLTRHAVAVGQSAFSGLLIHLTGGRIETHFHIFGSLAFLACYRDWRVIVTASVLVIMD